MAQIILISGGMDSLLSRRLFYPDAIPVFVRTSSRYEARDLAAARQQFPRLQVLEAAPLREWANGVVPHRNALLLSVVANWYAADEIVVSAPRGELIWDQQPGFHRTMEKALRGVRIVNPLRRLTKTQAVAKFLQEFPRQDWQLLLTRSCYSGTEHRCGQCAACVKRWVAMKNNGFEEVYAADVRAHARKLAKLGTWWDAVRYGLRPTLEAARALREP